MSRHATDIVMPRLSDSMEKGTILKWMKSAGDEVAVGDELVEIETDKANMIYEADAAGTLIEITASEGDTLPIGELIARVGEAGEASGAGAAAGRTEEAEEGRCPGETDGPRDAAAEHGIAEARATRRESESPAAAGPLGDGRVKASPLARRIAREKGLDIGAIHGSGPGGRIVKVDVEAVLASGSASAQAILPRSPTQGGRDSAPSPVQAGSSLEEREAPPAPPYWTSAGPTPGARERPETAKGETEVVDLTKLQATVARRMAESKATAPHFYLEAEIDMSRCVEARARLKAAAAEGAVVPSLNDMVVKACAIALREHRRANGAYRDGKLELYSRVNVGVAVAAREALVVPTIFDADRKGLATIAAEARALAQRVREGTVTPPELSGGTFTVSNLGMYGITSFAAVINPPQAGILAVGEIAERPVVRDGEIATAHLMGVNLACDHRILYGADGAAFLGRIRSLLEEPLGLAC